MVLAFAALLTASLLVLNYYPQHVVRQQMISASRDELLGRATTLAAAMEGFPSVTWENADTAVAVLDAAQGRRVLVLDSGGLVIYDSLRTGQLLGRVALYPEVLGALGGSDSFYCDYSPDAFLSRAASPILRDGTVAGVVCLRQDSEDNAALLGEIRRDIYQISLGATMICMLFLLLFNLALGRRFSTLLMGVHAVGSGDYEYRIRMNGADELSEVAGEFNELSVKLQRTENMRRQFVSDASHELKTPLASIKLLSDSIVQSPDIRPAEMREFVSDIGEEIGRLTRITERLLSLSQLDALPEVRPVCCDMGQTARKCAQLLAPTAELLDVRLLLEFTGSQMVRGTQDGIYHIVFNLMENAVKYNKRGGRVTVRFFHEKDRVVFSVEDTGIGIPERDLPRVYERFYRVDKARSRASGGTGLGLAIVKEWVTTLDGELRAESVYGQGTTFTVLLPAWTEDDA